MSKICWSGLKPLGANVSLAVTCLENSEKDAAEQRACDIVLHVAVMMGNSHGDHRK